MSSKRYDTFLDIVMNLVDSFANDVVVILYYTTSFIMM